ncbi:MAG: phosphotransferase [Firmicutes bacterium HGW-Firmicutes-16]|nr:MAG: phosphotransferase [Firmicutes bacterium HGW-Firmicutes-16]
MSDNASAGTYKLESLGEPLFTSRSSQIFSWQGNTLLKLFRSDVDPVLIENEEINTTETYDKGVSLVKCYGHVQVEDRTGIIIERVEGKTLISLAGSKPLTVFKVPSLMAELQLKMHNTHTDKIRSYKKFVLDALDSKSLGFLTEEEKQIALKQLSALPDGDSILHFDYHPDNIMSDGKTTTIIDWMTAARGAPAADIAATLYLLNEGEMIPGLSKAVATILETIRKTICKKYYAAYKKKTGMTDADVVPWRLPFLIFRLSVWHIDSEICVLQDKIRDELRK